MPKGANRDRVRRRNLSTVLGQVHRAGQLSRSALTTSTGLNRSTIGTLVADLEARGLVSEGETASTGSPGRPSTLVRTRGDRVAVLAADVQVSRITFAVISLGGSVHQRIRIDRPADARGVEATLVQLVDLVEGAIAQAGRTRIVGVGISVAGIVRGEDGFVHLAPNLGWRDAPLGALLSERLPRPDMDVVIGNEADLGALAEHVRGAGAGTQDMVYVSGEIGVGGGVIVGGRPLAGGSGYAGEIGHMVIDPDGPPCHCGSNGCWETMIGLGALMRHMGWADSGERASFDAVLREAAAGGDRARQALATIGGHLGVGVANLINIFNPQRIVLGGVFGRAFPHLIDAVRTEVDRRSLTPSRSMSAITASVFGDDSSLLGAGEVALRGVLEDPTTVPLPDTDTDTDAAVAAGG